MSILVVPSLEEEPWPTLGPQVALFIEQALVHGPGDLRGQPAKLDAEKRGLLYRMYEVFPQGHPQAGRRRFRRVGVSLRKGSAKTEFVAWIAAVELHPEGPVRCVGWDEAGEPIGGPVTDPYIPLVAYTEEQSDELAYGALRVILDEGPLRGEFDVGLIRIMRRRGDGKAVSLASSPDARDGARTTFQVCDETHRWTLPRLKQAHRTMLANLPKRRLADPWGIEITTAPSPGEGSVAEATMDYALAVADGKRDDSRLFFFHRQANDGHTLDTKEDIRTAVLEASGPVAEWSDIEGIVEQWDDPTADRSYLERVWLNRPTKAADQAFNADRWRELADAEHVVPDGALITLGFDGSRYHDATGIIATEIATGFQWPIGLWERPLAGFPDWEVPGDQVDEAVAAAFGRYNVWRMYADPPHWQEELARWKGKYGDKRVLPFETSRLVQTVKMVQAFAQAIISGEISHDGNAHVARHIGHAQRRYVQTMADETGQLLWYITKDRPNSDRKIDFGIASMLSWEARRDAIALGVKPEDSEIYKGRSLLVLG